MKVVTNMEGEVPAGDNMLKAYWLQCLSIFMGCF